MKTEVPGKSKLTLVCLGGQWSAHLWWPKLQGSIFQRESLLVFYHQISAKRNNRGSAPSMAGPNACLLMVWKFQSVLCFLMNSLQFVSVWPRPYAEYPNNNGVNLSLLHKQSCTYTSTYILVHYTYVHIMCSFCRKVDFLHVHIIHVCTFLYMKIWSFLHAFSSKVKSKTFSFDEFQLAKWISVMSVLCLHGWDSPNGILDSLKRYYFIWVIWGCLFLYSRE